MKRKLKGQLTIFLSLTLTVFLSLSLVLTDGVRTAYFQMEAEKAMDLAKFSVLSEYQKELFQKYGLFFIDLDYKTSSESPGILQNKYQNYLDLNAEELATYQLNIDGFTRATDSDGSVMFDQAVKYMKDITGVSAVQDILNTDTDKIETITDETNIEEEAEECYSTASSETEGQVDIETGEEIEVEMPEVEVPTGGMLIDIIFGGDDNLSKKTIDVNNTLDSRPLMVGTGRETEGNFIDTQLFNVYLLKHFSSYVNKDEKISKEALEYQLEYIIAGKSSDIENLKSISLRLLLLRAGSDYLFIRMDEDKMLEAELIAGAIALASCSENAFEAIKELIILGWAIDQAISEVKDLFAGNKVPLYQNGEDSQFEMGYEDYMYLFLFLTNRQDKALRGMDIMEGEIRKLTGIDTFKIDHCISGFNVEWIMEFNSIFVSIPYRIGNKYQYQLCKKIQYE